jgi:hypothetical protein
LKKDDLKPFEELAHSDRIVRLDGFGGIQSNLDEYDNPLLECFFTPQVEHFNNNERRLIPIVNEQFRAGIAVGYLPGITIGQFFKKGKRLPLKDWPRSETITFDLDVLNPQSVQEVTLSNLDLHSIYLADQYKEHGNQNGLKLLNGILIKTDNKKKSVDLPEIVVINEIELIRYYLTNTTHSCKNIFTGAFSDEELYKRVINNLHENETLDPITGAARLVYRHGYTSNDVPILARIMFEPNKLALNAAQRVHSKIVADRVNSSSGLYGYPRTYFPFTGHTRLKLNGRRLKTKTGYIFLAYRIISCSSLFPYTSLSYCDEIEPGGNPAPPDAPPAFPGANTTTTGGAHQPGKPGTSKSTQRPQSNSALIHIELSKREYPGLKNVEIKREKLRDSTYSSNKKFQEETEGMNDGSTGAGTSAKSSAARQSLSNPIDAERLPADLTIFIEIIDGLRILYPHWTIETIAVGNGEEVNGEWRSYFPPVPCEKRKKIMRQFSYMDNDKTQLKSFICVQIEIDSKYIYLFESQRRVRDQQTTQGSIYLDSLPVLLVWANGFSEVIPNDFLDMIKATVKNQTWPTSITGFNRDYTVHGAGAKLSEDMAVRVAQLIHRNLK